MRKFKNLVLVLVLFAAGTTNLWAVSLEQVCKELASHPNTTGDFTQVKTINSAKGARNLKSSGNFIFCLDGIMWKTLKPFPSSLVIGPTYVIQIGPDGKKSVIDASDNQTFASVAQTLTAIFSNDLTKLTENFVTDFKETEGGAWELALTPKDNTIKAVLNTVTLTGYSANGTTALDSIIMTESGESKITYTFLNQKYPKELTADEKAAFTTK